MTWFWHSLITIGILFVGYIAGAFHIAVTRAMLKGDDLKKVESLEQELRDLCEQKEDD